MQNGGQRAGEALNKLRSGAISNFILSPISDTVSELRATFSVIGVKADEKG